MITNNYAANNRAQKNLKQILKELKGETGSSTVVVDGFST